MELCFLGLPWPAHIQSAAVGRKQLTGITEAIERRINNGRHEDINSNVRLIIRRVADGGSVPEFVCGTGRMVTSC